MYFQTSEHLGTPITRGCDVTAADTLDTFQCRSINDNNNGGSRFYSAVSHRQGRAHHALLEQDVQ